jgi:hypothetical protein
VSLLAKLHITSTAPAETLQSLFDLINECFEGKVVAEASTRNSLTKLQNSVSKLLATKTVLPESSSPQQAEKDDDDAAAETTELDAAEGATELEQVEEEEGDETLGMSLMRKSMGFPDAEGTVFGDEEDSDGTVRGDVIKHEDDSLVESLLEDDYTVL